MIELSPMPVADPVAEIAPLESAAKGVPWSLQIATIVTIVVPFPGLVAAPFFFWGWGFRWVDLGLLVGMYVLTVVGITVGFHRLCHVAVRCMESAPYFNGLLRSHRG